MTGVQTCALPICRGTEHSKDGFLIRRSAVETGVNVLTAIDTAKALIGSLENADQKNLTLVDIAQEIYCENENEML